MRAALSHDSARPRAITILLYSAGMAAKRRKEAATAVDGVVLAVKDGIRSGKFAPGQRLVEIDLTHEFETSRSTLREAMWRLAGEGLITLEPNRGAIVTKITRNDIVDIYAIREYVEGLAARSAAEAVRSGGKYDALRKAKELTEKSNANRDVGAYVDANEVFHNAIVELSGNARLMVIIEQLRFPVFRLQLRRMLTPGASMKSASEHDDIYDAIVSGQPSLAEKKMRKHVRTSGQLLVKLLEKN